MEKCREMDNARERESGPGGMPVATMIMKQSAGSGISMMLFISTAAVIPKSCAGIEGILS
jgi:hypothetical protein